MQTFTPTVIQLNSLPRLVPQLAVMQAAYKFHDRRYGEACVARERAWDKYTEAVDNNDPEAHVLADLWEAFEAEVIDAYKCAEEIEKQLKAVLS
jgi:hypothetical protein